MYFNLKNIFSLVLFVLSPVLGLLYTISKFKFNNRDFFYFLTALFFSLMVFKNPPAFDAIRYLEMYDYVDTTYLTEFSNYISFYYVSYFLKNIGIPFYFIPVLYVFFSTYFLLKSVDILYLKSSLKRSYLSYIFLIFGLIVLLNPIVVGLVMRNYLSLSFFIYGFVNFYFGKKSKTLIFFTLSIFSHFSFIGVIFIFVLSFFIRLNKIKTLFLIILGLVFSKIVFSKFIFLLPGVGIQDHYSSYLDYSQYADYTNNMILATYMSYTLKSCIIFLSLLLYSVRSQFKEIFNIMLWFLVAVSFVNVSDTAAERIFNVATVFSYIFIMFNLTSRKRDFLYLIFLTLSIVLYFVILEVYMYRYSILYGDYLKNVFYPVFQFFLYTDESYRELINYLNSDGSWK